MGILCIPTYLDYKFWTFTSEYDQFTTLFKMELLVYIY